MVIDSSALVAILLDEPISPAVAAVMETAPLRLLSAANLLETAMVIEGRSGESGGRELDLLIYRAEIEIVTVDKHQAELARMAWRRFGKSRHAAALNYGDCFAYALAKSRGLPLLFVGDDFSRTDIEVIALA